jgi:acyl-CoA synthetase (AMP-forming)/AMP-acid ligase II
MMSSNRLTESVSSVSIAQRWGDGIAVESIKGLPFRMYSRRPHRLEEVLELADGWGSRPYVVQGERVVTFAGLRGAVAKKSAHLLDLDVEPLQHVLLLGFNSPDWIVNFWACVNIGAVPVLANAWWGEVEVSDAIDLLEPAIVLADARGTTKLPAACRRGTWEVDLSVDRGAGGVERRTDRSSDEEDPAVVIFTSGTSGRPKAAVLPHRSLLANLQMLLNLTHRLPHEVDENSGEVALHTGPLFHIGGGQMLLRSIVVGNTIVMPAGRFDPAEAIALIERYKVTRWAAVPTMVSRLLDHPDLQIRDVSSLRSVTIGGAPIHAELLQRIGSMLPSVTTGVPTGWGLTENGGQATAASGRDTLKHPGSAGRPLPLAQLKFLPVEGLPDDEILVRSPTQMSGYAGGVESPIDAEGWLHTGDLGHLDENGRLWITGRSKDLIIRGGENVAPAAVERALMNIAGVVEAAVVGVPDPDLGEEVCAFVVVDDQSKTPESLRDQLRGEVASFAVPSVWHVQQEPLPTNQTGKVDKPALARRAAGLVGMEATDPDMTPMVSDTAVGGLTSQGTRG